MLLTGGQLSAAISSFIVFIFTSALFLSGYILQQRTVHNIQTILHPPPTPTPTILNPVVATSQPIISSHRQHILSSTSSAHLNWKRHAYASLVRHHGDVCSTVMQFAELTRAASPAQKALFYPAAWDDEMALVEAGTEVLSKELRTTMRLLQKARKQYKVGLFPMVPAKGTRAGSQEEGEQIRDVNAAYPLASLLTLTGFERVVSLLPTGLVLDAELLDSLFAEPMNASVVAVKGEARGLPQAVLLKPSMATFQKAMRMHATGNKMPDVMQEDNIGTDRPWMLSTTRSLGEVPPLSEEAFNATEFYDGAAYMRFEDEGVLGPEWDVPANNMIKARPKHPQAKSVWEGIYDRFRTERMAVCGLDTDPLPMNKDAALKVQDPDE